MKKQKLLTYLFHTLGFIGTGFFLSAVIPIINRFPNPKATILETFCLSLGFGLMAVSIAYLMLYIISGNKASDKVAKVLAWMVGIDGIVLTIISFFIL